MDVLKPNMNNINSPINIRLIVTWMYWNNLTAQHKEKQHLINSNMDVLKRGGDWWMIEISLWLIVTWMYWNSEIKLLRRTLFGLIVTWMYWNWCINSAISFIFRLIVTWMYWNGGFLWRNCKNAARLIVTWMYWNAFTDFVLS